MDYQLYPFLINVRQINDSLPSGCLAAGIMFVDLSINRAMAGRESIQLAYLCIIHSERKNNKFLGRDPLCKLYNLTKIPVLGIDVGLRCICTQI